MAIQSTKTRLVIGSATEAWDFSGVSNSLEVKVAGEKIDNTRFQDTAKRFTTGETEGTITQNGYFDETGALSFEQEIAQTVLNLETLWVCAIYGTDQTVPVGYIAPSTNTENMAISAPIGGLITLNGSWLSGLGLKRGFQVYRGTISATGTSSYIDVGAVGSAGGYAWLFVTTVTGTATNADIDLESDDNTSFTSAAVEGTFTFTGKGVTQVTLSGTIDRYLRLNTTDLGGATSFLVTVIAAVSGVTY